MLVVFDVAETNSTQAWLSFLSTLIWQLIIIFLLVVYGRTVGALLTRLLRVKFAGFEGEFQVESPQALQSHAAVEVKTLGIDGFLTKAGIEELISKSGLLQSDEKTKDSLLIFETPSQRTWLVSTGKNLFCVLDDASTRESGNLIQWKEMTAAIKRVAAWKEGKRYAVDIGKHGCWLYSPNLHTDPEGLKEQLSNLLS